MSAWPLNSVVLAERCQLDCLIPESQLVSVGLSNIFSECHCQQPDWKNSAGNDSAASFGKKGRSLPLRNFMKVEWTAESILEAEGLLCWVAKATSGSCANSSAPPLAPAIPKTSPSKETNPWPIQAQKIRQCWETMQRAMTIGPIV